MADFAYLSNIFGGTIYCEEYRGDLDSVLSLIENLEKENDGSDAGKEAEVLLLRAIFHMFCGNFSNADACLETLAGIDIGLPERWNLRRIAYTQFFVYLRRYPPYLRFRPEQGTPLSVLKPFHSKFMKALPELIRAYNQHVRSATPQDRLESFTINRLLEVPATMNIAHVQNPAKISNFKSGIDPSVLEKMLVTLRNMCSIALEMKMISIGAYFARICYEIEHERGLEIATKTLAKIQSAYLAEKDWAGLAAAKMLEADHLVSPNSSSPIALNLMPIDTLLQESGMSDWDASEKGFPLNDIESARTLYNEALDLFIESKSPRGAAAVMLRLGCITHMQALSPATEKEDISGLLDAAATDIEDAIGLFGRDEANVQIAKGHGVLIDISRGKLEQVVSRTGAIGEWGVDANNESISQFIGLLVLRFGRRRWVDSAASETAIACFKCAQELFVLLKDGLLSLRSAAAMIQVYYDLNNFSTAKYMIDQHLPHFREQLNEIEVKANADEVEEIRLGIRIIRNDLITEFGTLVNYVYSRSNDVEAIERWQEEWQRLIDPTKRAEVLLPEAYRSQASAILGMKNEGAVHALLRYYKATNDVQHQLHLARSAYNAALQNADVDAALEVYQGFLKSTATSDASTRCKTLYPIIVYYAMGETQKARALLANMHDWENYDVLNVKNYDKRDDWSFALVYEEPKFIIETEILLIGCAMAADWTRGHRVLTEVEKLVPKFLDQVEWEHPFEADDRFLWAGLIFEFNGEYMRAFQLFFHRCQLNEMRVNQVIDQETKRVVQSSSNSPEAYMGLARICIRCSELGLPLQILDSYRNFHPRANSWSEHALLFTEQCIARYLHEALKSTPESDPSETGSRTAMFYKRRLLFNLRSLPASKRSAQEEQELKSLEAELEGSEDSVIFANAVASAAEIESNPLDMYKAIRKDTIVLSGAFSRHGCSLFAITNAGIMRAINGSCRDTDMQKLALRIRRNIQHHEFEESSSPEILDSLLSSVSEIIVNPFADLIKQHNHVIFSISQPLTMFPFSALFFENQPLFLQKAVYQVPSVTCMSHLAHKSEAMVARVSTITKAGSLQDYVATGERPLPMAGLEAIGISRMFDAWPIDAKTMDREQFQESLKSSNVVHIGTHGQFDLRSPWLSYISLKERLRVLDLTPVRSSAALIVFAACLSGLGKETISSDVLGFSHVMLETGALAFLGALWSVDDEATMLLMILFYRELRNTPGGLSIAELWQRAQVKFYNLDAGRARELFFDLVKAWDEAENAGFRPNEIVKNGKKKLLEKSDRFELDFKHPFHWAAFSLVGYGSYVFKGKGDTQQSTMGGEVHNSVEQHDTSLPIR